jgi:hypothetical protein
MPISSEARRDLGDTVLIRGLPWSGSLDEVAFLGRLYDLDDLPSFDNRFKTAAGDVRQHRVNNLHDWDDDWVFHDPRFNVLGGDDENLLAFLSEMLHPLVRRSDGTAVAELAEAFNEILRPEGWELVAGSKKVGGLPLWSARPLAAERRHLADAAEEIVDVLSSDYIARQVQRMEAAIDTDPDLAIGTAKEFVESVAKAILQARLVEFDPKLELYPLVQEVAKELRLAPKRVDEDVKAAETVRRLLGNLAQIVQALAELRNAYGTGHGKALGSTQLAPRHAALAVNASITLATFLFNTHEDPSRI